MNIAAIAIRVLAGSNVEYNISLARGLYAVAHRFCQPDDHRGTWEEVWRRKGRNEPSLTADLKGPLDELCRRDTRPLERLRRAPLNTAERIALLRLVEHAKLFSVEGGDARSYLQLAHALAFLYFVALHETGYGSVNVEEFGLLARIFDGPIESGPLSSLADNLWLEHIIPEQHPAGTAPGEALPSITS